MMLNLPGLKVLDLCCTLHMLLIIHILLVPLANLVIHCFVPRRRLPKDLLIQSTVILTDFCTSNVMFAVLVTVVVKVNAPCEHFEKTVEEPRCAVGSLLEN